MGWPWAGGTLRTYDGDAVFLPSSLTGERTHGHLMHFLTVGWRICPGPVRPSNLSIGSKIVALLMDVSVKGKEVSS